MNIEIRTLPSERAVCIRHLGPYPGIGETFGKFRAWQVENGFATGFGVAFFYDDPRSTPPEELRSDAGAFVADDFEILDEIVHMVETEAGSYAVATFVGAYAGLPEAWQQFTQMALPAGYGYRNAIPYERYVKMGSLPGGEDSVTELHMAVQAL